MQRVEYKDDMQSLHCYETGEVVRLSDIKQSNIKPEGYLLDSSGYITRMVIPIPDRNGVVIVQVQSPKIKALNLLPTDYLDKNKDRIWVRVRQIII